MESSGQFAFQLNSEQFNGSEQVNGSEQFSGFEQSDSSVTEPISLAAHLGRSETRELARSLVPEQPIWLFSGRKASHRASGRH